MSGLKVDDSNGNQGRTFIKKCSSGGNGMLLMLSGGISAVQVVAVIMKREGAADLAILLEIERTRALKIILYFTLRLGS